MRIAVLSFYSGFVNRGVEVWVDNLARRLAKKHEIVIFQTGPIKEKKNYQIKRIKVKNDWPKDFTKSWQRKLFLDYYSRLIFQFSLKALGKVKKDGFDLVLPLNGGWQTLLTKFFCLVWRKKIVVGGHSGIGWDDRFNLYCRPDVFVALSQRGFLWAKKVCPWVKIKRIPDGVDLKRFRKKGKRVSLGLQKPLILTVSAFQEYKRIDTVIRAVACLSKGSLLLIGSGDKKQEEFIDNLGRKLLGKNRFLRLTVRHKEIPSYYRAGDLFTLVSESSEAFGIVYLEAMASGLPVVATDDSLRREIIGRAGLFIKNPEESQKYASVLEKALKMNWQNKPRKQAEKFSWDKIAKKYEEVFLSLV